MLVSGQVALSLLLLIGAALLLRSYSRLLRVDAGFDPQNVITMNLSLPTVKYAKPEQQIAFFDELLRRIAEVPGVKSAAISAALPLSSKRITPMLPEGQPNVPLAQRPFIDIEAISPQWLRTMRVPLRAGREFTAVDNAQAPKVVIVNESFARQFWPNQNPIGKHVIVGRGTQAAEVVGVAADVKNRGLALDPQPQVYIAFPQLPWSNMNLLVRTAVAPLSLLSALRAQIASVDPDQPITNIETVDGLMESSLTQPRFTMLLLGIFSVTALMLAVIGIYGVLAYSVAQRRHELGIRLALGATPANIMTLIVGGGMSLAFWGVFIGIAGALVVGRLMRSLVFGVGVTDVVTFVAVPALLACIAFLASYVPARRASRIDPSISLRCE